MCSVYNTMTRNSPNSRPKSAKRLPKSALTVSSLAPHRTSSPSEPMPVVPTITVTKWIQVVLPIDSSGTSLIVSPSVLSAGVPGGLTFWSTVRFEQFRVYGDQVLSPEDPGRLRVSLTPNSGWSQPTFDLEDVGTLGRMRPHVGFMLGLLDRARWFNTADTTNLFQIIFDATSSITVQAKVTLTSPNLP